MKIIVDKLEIRILTSTTDVDGARALLYNVYEEYYKQRDNESTNNTSAISVITLSDGKKILTDKYDAEAVWIGCFYSGTLVGCGRICYPEPSTGRFEFQDKAKSNALDKFMSAYSDKPVIELGRGAVDKQYQGNGIIMVSMLRFLCVYCIENKLSVFTQPVPRMSKILQLINWPIVEGLLFQYGTSKVNIHFADVDKGEIYTMLTNINQLLPVMERAHNENSSIKYSLQQTINAPLITDTSTLKNKTNTQNKCEMRKSKL